MNHPPDSLSVPARHEDATTPHVRFTSDADAETASLPVSNAGGMRVSTRPSPALAARIDSAGGADSGAEGDVDDVENTPSALDETGDGIDVGVDDEADEDAGAAATAAATSAHGESVWVILQRMLICRGSAKVPLLERWERDPLTKWIRYGVFPRSVCLHLLLLISVTSQIVLLNTTTSAFSQNLHNSFVAWLYPDNYALYNGNSLTFATDTYYAYSTDVVNASWTKLFNTYYSMDNAATTPVIDLIDVYQPGGDGGLAIPTLTYTSPTDVSSLLLAAACNDSLACTDTSLRGVLHTRVTPVGSFQTVASFPTLADFNAWQAVHAGNAGALSTFLQSITSLTAHIQLRAYNLAYVATTSRTCLLWDISVLFDMSSKGYVLISLDDYFNACTRGWAAPTPLLFLAGAIILFATLQQLTLIRAAVRSWRVMLWISILSQAARYNRRQAKIRRMIVRLQRRNRQDVIADANRALASDRDGPPPTPRTPGTVEAAAAARRIRAARIVRLKRLLAGNQHGTLDTTVWPVVRALFRIDRHSHTVQDAVDSGVTSITTTTGASTMIPRLAGAEDDGTSSGASTPPRFSKDMPTASSNVSLSGSSTGASVPLTSPGGAIVSTDERARLESEFDSDLSSIASLSSATSLSNDGFGDEDDDDEDEAEDASCSCSSSELSEEDPDAGDANLTYLGLHARRRRSSSSSGSSCSTRERGPRATQAAAARTNPPTSATAHATGAPDARVQRGSASSRSRSSSSSSRSSSSSSSSDSTASIRRRKRAGKSMAQRAAIQAFAAERRARARKRKQGNSVSASLPQGFDRMRSGSASSSSRDHSSSSSSSSRSRSRSSSSDDKRRPRRRSSAGGRMRSGSGTGPRRPKRARSVADGAHGVAPAPAPQSLSPELSSQPAASSSSAAPAAAQATSSSLPTGASLVAPQARLTPLEQALLFRTTIDWADPSFLRASASSNKVIENTQLLKAVHRVRHAARHVRHAHLLALTTVWPIISSLANTFNIVYACLALINGEAAVPGDGRIFLALAAAFDWLAVSQYFKYNGNYYLMFRTFSVSFPAIMRNAASALPIYFSFALFACMVFGGLTERFDGLPFSAITLFAVANGDIVRESFQLTLFYQVGWFFQSLAQITMYLFSFTFIYCILKTTTAINEQSYLLVRPLPSGATPGARAAAIPGTSSKPDSAPLAYRLPARVREMLRAMQAVRAAGGSMTPIVKLAALSMPLRRNYKQLLWNACACARASVLWDRLRAALCSCCAGRPPPAEYTALAGGARPHTHRHSRRHGHGGGSEDMYGGIHVHDHPADGGVVPNSRQAGASHLPSNGKVSPSIMEIAQATDIPVVSRTRRKAAHATDSSFDPRKSMLLGSVGSGDVSKEVRAPPKAISTVISLPRTSPVQSPVPDAFYAINSTPQSRRTSHIARSLPSVPLDVSV